MIDLINKFRFALGGIVFGLLLMSAGYRFYQLGPILQAFLIGAGGIILCAGLVEQRHHL